MNKTVLITGASSGIGLELAKIFAREGYQLVIIARREERLVELKHELEEKYNVQVTCFVCDLIEFDAANKIFQFVRDKNIRVDILVNNAGFGLGGEFAVADLTRLTEMVQVNITALMQLTRLFLPGMIERKSGKILNVGSVAGFLPGPLHAIYFATKSFVISFSEAIAYELKDKNVTVTVLCPGPVKTEFQKVAYKEKAFTTDQRKIPTAKETAEFGYRALMQGTGIAVPNVYNKCVLFLLKILPRSVVLNLVRAKQSTHQQSSEKNSA